MHKIMARHAVKLDLLGYSGEISPTRCNNCVFLFVMALLYMFQQEARHRTTRQRLPTTPQQ